VEVGGVSHITTTVFVPFHTALARNPPSFQDMVHGPEGHCTMASRPHTVLGLDDVVVFFPVMMHHFAMNSK
jgi:hypothetical protein